MAASVQDVEAEGGLDARPTDDDDLDAAGSGGGFRRARWQGTSPSPPLNLLFVHPP